MESVETLAKKRLEPTWFEEIREKASQLIGKTPYPDFKKLKYKDWDLHLTGNFVSTETFTANANVAQAGENLAQINLPDEYRKKGVIVADFHEALQNYPKLVQKYFMTKGLKASDDEFLAEHVAYLQSGLFIYVPKDVQVEIPLTCEYLQKAALASEYVHHVLLIVDEGSSFSYIEKLTSQGNEKSKVNFVCEVIAKKNSHVHFTSIDNLAENVTSYLNRRGYLEKDAKVDWAMALMNDGRTLGDFNSDLVGDGSHAELKAVGISTNSQIQGINTRVTNYGNNTIGHILQHGVSLDKSTLIFNAVGHIMKGSKGSDAEQESRILMLSQGARGDANPILLIDDNDVMAGHAASIGRVNPEQLYYLMSRGLDKKMAERVVIRGFLSPVLEEIPTAHLKQVFSDLIERKISEK